MSECNYEIKSRFGKLCGIISNVTKDEIVVIVHGFSSTKNTMPAKQIEEILRTMGLSTLRVDLDDMGESSLPFRKASFSNYVDEMSDVIADLKLKGYKNISLIGSSFGGYVCLGLCDKFSDIKRCFLRAPVISFQEHFERKKTPLQIEKYKKRGYWNYIDGNGENLEVSINTYLDSLEYDFFKIGNKNKIPTLILHGTKDKSVPHDLSVRYARENENVDVKIIEGANHALAVDKDWSEHDKYLKEFFERRI